MRTTEIVQRVIFQNDKLVVAIEEERIRRVKHWAGFPSESIKFCLNECGIGIEDVDYITISRDPFANIYQKVTYSIKNFINFKTLKDRLVNSKKVNLVKDELSTIFNINGDDIKAKIAKC